MATFDLFSVYQKTIDHLNLKLLIFVGIMQVLRFDFKKFRTLENLNLHPCVLEDISRARLSRTRTGKDITMSTHNTHSGWEIDIRNMASYLKPCIEV